MRYLVGFALVVALSFVGGCNDEVEVCAYQANTWKKDDPPPLPEHPAPVNPDDMLDTYTLTHFAVCFHVGDEHIGCVFEDEVASFSGRLEITEDTITSTVTIEGETETLGGPYTHTSTGDRSGVFVIASQGYELLYGLTGYVDAHGSYVAITMSSSEPVCEMTTL
jgi:hypothetical protein